MQPQIILDNGFMNTYVIVLMIVTFAVCIYLFWKHIAPPEMKKAFKEGLTQPALNVGGMKVVEPEDMNVWKSVLQGLLISVIAFVPMAVQVRLLDRYPSLSQSGKTLVLASAVLLLIGGLLKPLFLMAKRAYPESHFLNRLNASYSLIFVVFLVAGFFFFFDGITMGA
jgi:hypothetical protein